MRDQGGSMLARFFCAISVAYMLAACGSASVSMAPAVVQSGHPVKVIAFASGGGVLADAVAVELANRGFTVVDPGSTSGLIARMGLTEFEVSMPIGLARLKEQGIDAYLTIRSAGGSEGSPASASARITSTHNGQVLGGLTWQNGWGGQEGSPADRVMRSGLTQAASQIAEALVTRIPR